MQAAAGAVRFVVFRAAGLPRFQLADDLPGLHPVPNGSGTRNRFEAAQQAPAVIDREDSPVHHPAAKPDRPCGRGQDRISGAGCEIHSAVPGQPALGRLIEPADNLRFGVQRPLPGQGRCGACGSLAHARRPQCCAGGKDCGGQYQNTGSQPGRRPAGTRQRTGNRRNTHAGSPPAGTRLEGRGTARSGHTFPGRGGIGCCGGGAAGRAPPL